MVPRAKENDLIIDFLVSNHTCILEAIAPYQKQREELLKQFPKFKDKIMKQYKDIAMFMIAESVGIEYGIDSETVVVFLESFDLMEYLSGEGVEWCR